MYEHILVPTDGSERARAAAENAVGLAEDHGATVHALYVMDMGNAAFVATPSDISETRSRLEAKGEEFTREVAEMAAEAGVDCVTATRAGTPAEEIVGYAEDNGVDLVVMGKRGRSDPDKPAFGSITNRVVGAADARVLTV